MFNGRRVRYLLCIAQKTESDGPNATSFKVTVGSYQGTSDNVMNFTEGITAAVGPGTRVEYDQGYDYKDTIHFGGT